MRLAGAESRLKKKYNLHEKMCSFSSLKSVKCPDENAISPLNFDLVRASSALLHMQLLYLVKYGRASPMTCHLILLCLFPNINKVLISRRHLRIDIYVTPRTDMFHCHLNERELEQSA